MLPYAATMSYTLKYPSFPIPMYTFGLELTIVPLYDYFVIIGSIFF